MGRNFREALENDRCWDRNTQTIFDARGEPLDDVILQNREELIGLCEFIEKWQVRSYLEVGVWTGRLASALHRLFCFDRVALCDDGYARRFGFPVHIPEGAHYFEGRSESDAFLDWREKLGKVDLVFIDANHAYHAVRRDFEIACRFPHRFLAFHDITGANRHTAGVRRFWEELEGGCKHAIVRPHLELGLDRSEMGIGIWWEDASP